MTIQEVPVELMIGVLGVIAMVIANTAGLFYWGGKVSRAINLLEKIADDHEQRLRSLEHG